MIIFETNIGELRKNIDSLAFYKQIAESYEKALDRRASSGEQTSWQDSIPPLFKLIEKANIDDEVKVLIEFTIPQSGKRIDVVLCGKDENSKDTAVIVELKRWENIKSSLHNRMVIAHVGGRDLNEHPSSQVLTYRDDLNDIDSNFSNINLFPIAYLHNNDSLEGEGPLASIYQKLIDEAPVYNRKSENELVNVLASKLRGGPSQYVYKVFKEMKYNPSSSLVDNAKQFGNDIEKAFSNITLWGDQKSAFNIIRDNIIQNTNDETKNVFLINGTSGTGKTIVALKLYLHLVQSQSVGLVFPGTDFRNTIINLFDLDSREKRKLFGGRLKGQPTKPNTFKKNEFNFIIVDETHKLMKKASMSAVIPLDDLLSKTNNMLMLYDYKQVVNKNSYNELNRFVKHCQKSTKVNFIELDLKNQFRSIGGNNFIDWLDSKLYPSLDIEEGIPLLSSEFKFNVIDKPEQLILEHEHNAKSNYRSRILATAPSFTWTKKITNGELFKDITIGNKKYPWFLPNSPSIRKNVEGLDKLTKKQLEAITFDFNLDDIKANDFIGYYNTVQGNEFYHTSIYVGKEYYVNDKGELDFNEEFIVDKNATAFHSLKNIKNKEERKEKHLINREIAINQLRVLMTRARNAITIYFEDPSVRMLFKI